MRRGKPLKRGQGLKRGDKPLARRKGLEQGKPLKRKKPLRAKPPGKGKPLKLRYKGRIDRVASEAWALGVRTKACAMCGRKTGGSVVVRGHHILYQQHLRQWARELGVDVERLRWDTRNRLPLCDDCHERHHARSRPVPVEVLRRCAPKLWQFAAEIDRRFERGRAPAAAFIDRAYPSSLAEGDELREDAGQT